MSEGEAKALVSKCDKDGSKGIDFAEFALAEAWWLKSSLNPERVLLF